MRADGSISTLKREATEEARRGRWPRRSVLKFLTVAGAGAVFGRALVSVAAERAQVTEEMVRQAEWVAGVDYTDDERKLMLEGVNELLDAFSALREIGLDNSVPPALFFRPDALDATPAEEPLGRATPTRPAAGQRPSSDEDLAFAPLTELAALIRTRQVSSVELTELYLRRLERYDPELACVISLTAELALEQARRADREIAAGWYRGPLHGVPWGAKDLLSVPG